MKTQSRKQISAACLAALTAMLPLAQNSIHAADSSVRQQKFETFAEGQWSTTGKISDFKFSESFMGGLGLGYNFTDQINVNADVLFTQVSLASKTTGVKLDANHIAAHANLDYYLFKSALTPFLTGGIGVDSYDGSQGVTSISKADFAYKVGGGLRWDITRHIFVKGLYRAAWADIRKFENAHTIALMLGFKF